LHRIIAGETMIFKRLLAPIILVAGIALSIAQPASAQPYPNKLIKMIVPFPPGGPIDITARLIAQQMSRRFNQQIIIENRPGAGTTLGMKVAASADPDGYTLVFGSSGSLAVAPALYPNIDYDPIKSFVPIATVALIPHVMVISNAVPAKSVREFVTFVKGNPGKLNYGASLGSPPHLLSTLFATKAGLDVVFIPYKGSANSTTDLLAGQTQFTIDGLTVLFPLIKEGKVRALAMARAERWPPLPDVPTLVESGFPDFNLDAWTGVLAPAGTSPEIIATLNRVINESLQSSEMSEGLARFSGIAKTSSPQEFASFIALQIPIWAGLVKLSGAKAEPEGR
jgi:tripartite-type tricarboxylate transporter receptor subunit TctC